VPISDLCDELGLYPNQLYGWLKEFFERGHLAFDNGRKNKPVEDAEDLKIQKSKPSCNARTPSSPNSWKSTPLKKRA
jgi:transposase-like protein